MSTRITPANEDFLIKIDDGSLKRVVARSEVLEEGEIATIESPVSKKTVKIRINEIKKCGEYTVVFASTEETNH